MYINIHKIKKIVRDEITEHTDTKGEVYYALHLMIVYSELGTCNERYSDNTMHGDMEVEARFTLFADKKEALEVKAEAFYA